MKWGAVKKARQQIARMEKKGIRSQAADLFKSQQARILESGSPREAKITAMEYAARHFLESGMGTVKGIKAKFERTKSAQSKYVKGMIGDDPAKMAAYLDAEKNQRTAMAARYYLDSDTIRYIAEITTDKKGNTDPYKFYDILGKVTLRVATNPQVEYSPDALTEMILDYYERLSND